MYSKIKVKCVLWCVCVALGTEPRTSCMQGKHYQLSYIASLKPVL